MTRVLYVSPYPTTPGAPVGGVEAAMENLCAGLEGQRDLNCMILDIRPEFDRFTRQSGVLGPILRVPAGGPVGRIARSRRIVTSAIENWRPDIVHVQGVARLVPSRVPCVLTLHGFLEKDFQYEGGSQVRRLAKARLVVRREIRARASVRYVIAISEYSASQLPPNVGRVVWTIPNAIHPDALRHTAAIRRSGILFAGRITELKGVHVLIEAFRMVADEVPEARLTIAGPGLGTNYGAHCLALAERLGLRDVVQFPGSLDRAALLDAIGSSACLALPSMVEAAPVVVSESLALGTPVVAASVGALPEMVNPSVGELVPPGVVAPLASALRRWVTADTRSVGDAARAAGDAYAPTRIARLTVAAYSECLDLERKRVDSLTPRDQHDLPDGNHAWGYSADRTGVRPTGDS